jgi:hypothetical protein
MWPFQKAKELDFKEFQELTSLLLEMTLSKIQIHPDDSPAKMREDCKKMDQYFSRLRQLTGKTENELLCNNSKLLKKYLKPYENTVEYKLWSYKISKAKTNKRDITKPEFLEIISILHKIHDMGDDRGRVLREIQISQSQDSIAKLRKVKEETEAFIYRLSELTGATVETFQSNSSEILMECLKPYENTDEFMELDNKIKLTSR